MRWLTRLLTRRPRSTPQPCGFMSPVAAAARLFAYGLTGATIWSARCVTLGRLARPIRCIRTLWGHSASNALPWTWNLTGVYRSSSDASVAAAGSLRRSTRPKHTFGELWHRGLTPERCPLPLGVGMSGTCHENRLRIRVEGIVQGVGFRPFVYALATRLHVGGCVSNDSQGC